MSPLLPGASKLASNGERLRATVIRLRKPLLVLAGIGTVLGGLAGYLNAWRAVRAEAPPAALAERSAKGVPALSLLVLPLANQTGDADKCYVADGLTTAITDDLGRLPEIVVVPPLMAVGLQQRGLTLQQLGVQAGVRFVLQGAVLASGARLRVNAQLHDTHGGAQLWSTTFEGRLEDLFALQDDITARIRAAIEPKMVMTAARESDKRAAAPQLADLQRGIEVDPENDGMHAQLAVALAMRGDVQGARKAAATVLRINPKFDFGMDDDRPWLGREAAYRDYIETRLRPAVLLAGLPDSGFPPATVPATPSR